MWWYEILDLGRKLLLNGVLLFIGPDSAAQVPPAAGPPLMPPNPQSPPPPCDAPPHPRGVRG